MTTGQDFNFPSGTQIIGKWHGKTYRLLRKIGSGAQGIVYLAQYGSKQVAIKLAKDRASLIAEVNILQQVQQLQGDSLGPSLYDSDDWIYGRVTIGFCVMEYVHGLPASEVLRKRSFDWTIVFLIQLLDRLAKLHAAGYIFADLKPENLMIVDLGHRIRCVDFGGATKIGRSVREYTEFYDRGYWGMGTRKAEPSYDLFACAMIALYSATGSRFEKGAAAREQLLRKIKQTPQLVRFQPLLIRALSGRFTSAQQMRDALVQAAMEGASTQSPHRSRQAIVRPHPHPLNDWLRAWTTALFLITLYIICVIVYTM
ncbi:MAG: hypothetical protein ABF586_03450 [Sporolactobacillus sp.]